MSEYLISQSKNSSRGVVGRKLEKHLERDALDLLQLLHELLGVDGLAGARGSVGVGHAVLVLDAVLAARSDRLIGRFDVVEDACTPQARVG